MSSRSYWLFAGALAVTLIGFWPSFFSNPAGLDAAHVIHGSVATLWMGMLILQSWLISHRHYRPHRWIGRASLAVVPVLVVSGLMMVRAMLSDPRGLPNDLRLTLAYLDVTSLTLFVALYVCALVWRKTRVLHSRLMGSTVLVAVIPALGRVFAIHVPAIKGLAGALDPSFWVVEAVLVGLILHDLRRKLTPPPYFVVLGVFAAIQLTMFHAPRMEPFLHLARALGYSG